MATRTELLEILSNGENSGVEFKRDDISAQDLAKELVAFSNFEGGTVLLGVEDDGRVSGLIRNNLEEWVMNVCCDKIRPSIIPFFEIVSDVKDNQDVAIIRVTRGYDVHALWHNHTNKYLIRVGSGSREASNEELARLFQRRGLIRAEWQPVSGAALADFDPKRLRDYFSNLRQQNVPIDEDAEAWKLLLLNTEIMVEESASVGGMLLFGLMPNRFLPHAGIDAVAYAGTEQDYNAVEHVKLRGPMTPILSQEGKILENGLVEQALNFIKRNTCAVTEKDGGRRIERSTYPDDALREVIVNALIHRDYLLTNTDVVLAVYSDRLEIISPGRLPNGITPEGMRFGARATRNELLKDVMRDYRYLEHMGMGIPRKV
ncbi:MAG: putative DNA binding domain-containing protein, partial [Gammaproteobacteria bacterium]|nr:putative DNA binding domain-containing protein [Gammaproteobacteria bacterium]